MISNGSSTEAPRPFYGRPFLWVLFALLVFLIPAVGYIVDADMPWTEVHPAINALLNASSAVFLVVGLVAIKRKNIALHRQCMIAAFTASCVFLASYLVRFAMTGAHRYPGDGIDRTIYLAILASHTVLAATAVPLAVRALYLGLRGRYASHRRLAKWAWPVWAYVSFTGVVVYLMLYPIAGAVYGR
jgi:putative membrane protein